MSGLDFPSNVHLEDCPLCDGSGRVSLETYMKYGGKTKCFNCNGIGQVKILDIPDETS